MKAEGDCPDCGERLGVKVADGAMPVPKRTLKRLIDKDGNGMYCQQCDEYHDPEDLEVK